MSNSEVDLVESDSGEPTEDEVAGRVSYLALVDVGIAADLRGTFNEGIYKQLRSTDLGAKYI